MAQLARPGGPDLGARLRRRDVHRRRGRPRPRGRRGAAASRAARDPAQLLLGRAPEHARSLPGRCASPMPLKPTAPGHPLACSPHPLTLRHMRGRHGGCPEARQALLLHHDDVQPEVARDGSPRPIKRARRHSHMCVMGVSVRRSLSLALCAVPCVRVNVGESTTLAFSRLRGLYFRIYLYTRLLLPPPISPARHEVRSHFAGRDVYEINISRRTRLLKALRCSSRQV